ncbi:MAG: hypothetical protein ABSC06_18560 [Rhodopila sp.]
MAAALGFCEGWLCLAERPTVGENAVRTSVDQRDQSGLQRHTLLARKRRRVAGAAQQTLHLACPVLFLDLDQRIKFAQMGALNSACSPPVIVQEGFQWSCTTMRRRWQAGCRASLLCGKR